MTPRVNKQVCRLADGRELIYFDDGPGLERPSVDTRPGERRPDAPELRFDPLLDEWVAVASHRQTRTHLPPSDECPLCPSTPRFASEIPASSYDVAVFENRFPSFATPSNAPATVQADGGIGQRASSGGRCEVVCFTSDHDSAFAKLAPRRVRTVVEAWVDRTRELSRIPTVEQVFCFENRGEEIGVTLHHPHGQIYAYPFVTPRTQRMLESARRHRQATGGILFADVLAHERRERARVVAQTRHWTAFVPEAARWPVEVHLYPHRQVADLPGLSEDERADFGDIYLDVLRRLDLLFDTPLPYISAWHQAPVRIDRDLAYLHLQLTSVRRAPGKLKYLAGSESGMGVFINDVRPEELAARLRSVS